jgi:phospholipid/cholesterol/gamma-HCH transport system permease protein
MNSTLRLSSHYLISTIETIGSSAIRLNSSFAEAFTFYYLLTKKTLSPFSYNKPIIREILRQIYLTSYKNIFSVLFTSIIFGSLFVGVIMNTLKSYGLTDMTGDVVVKLFAVEIAPIITIILIMIRSSLAMNVELAQMKMHGEIKTLDYFGIDQIGFLFIPRVFSGIIAIVFLSYFFSVLMVSSAFVFSYLFFEINFDKFIYSVTKSIELSDLFIFFIKCTAVGLFIFTIPARNGLKSSVSMGEVGYLVSSGTLKLLFMIMTIEVLTLVIRFF